MGTIPPLNLIFSELFFSIFEEPFGIISYISCQSERDIYSERYIQGRKRERGREREIVKDKHKGERGRGREIEKQEKEGKKSERVKEI